MEPGATQTEIERAPFRLAWLADYFDDRAPSQHLPSSSSKHTSHYRNGEVLQVEGTSLHLSLLFTGLEKLTAGSLNGHPAFPPHRLPLLSPLPHPLPHLPDLRPRARPPPPRPPNYLPRTGNPRFPDPPALQPCHLPLRAVCPRYARVVLDRLRGRGG